MKSLILAVTLLLAPFASAETEKILLIRGSQISFIDAYLNKGWTVKHQNVSAAGATSAHPENSIVLVTLSPPTPEALAAAEKKRAEEAEKKKQEWNKKREECLKQQEAKNKVENESNKK